MPWWWGLRWTVRAFPASISASIETSGWEFAGHKVQVLEVPAHTRGAITFVIDGNAFTGDTLFAMGCGRLFEGDPEMMWKSLSKLMRLPDATRIYCGHEYTENNGRFALTLEPGNAALAARMTEVKSLRAAQKPSVPSTMGLEKQTIRSCGRNSDEIRKSLGLERADNVAVFGEMRRRKDNFQQFATDSVRDHAPRIAQSATVG